MPVSRRDTNSLLSEPYSEGLSEGSIGASVGSLLKKTYSNLFLERKNSILSFFEPSVEPFHEDDRTIEYDSNDPGTRFGTPVSLRRSGSIPIELQNTKTMNKLVLVESKRNNKKNKYALSESTTDSDDESKVSSVMTIAQPVYLSFDSQVGRKEYFSHQQAVRDMMHDLDYSWDDSKDKFHSHVPAVMMGQSKTKKIPLENTNSWANVGVGERSGNLIEPYSSKKVISTDYSKMKGRDLTLNKNTILRLEEEAQVGPGRYNPKYIQKRLPAIDIGKIPGRNAKVQHLAKPDPNENLKSLNIEKGFSLLSTTKDRIPNISFGIERDSKLYIDTGLPPSNDLFYDSKLPEIHSPTIEISKSLPHKEDEPIVNYLYTASKVIHNLQNNIKKVKKVKKKTSFVKKVVQNSKWMNDVYFENGVKETPLRLV